jgi:hypothetical protein
MRRNIEIINEANRAHRITLGERVLRTDLYRVFNGVFTRGGRFYGAPHQNLPEGRRAEIAINGDATIELAYRALHPKLLYNSLGLAIPDDPYDIAGWDRRHVKLGLLILINAENRLSAIRALAREIGGENPFAVATQLVAAIEDKHAPIAHYFGSGAGSMLQRKDSDMAEQVMLDLVEDGVGILPVHDSFIAPAQHRPQLEEAMAIALEKHISNCRLKLSTTPHVTQWLIEKRPHNMERSWLMCWRRRVW